MKIFKALISVALISTGFGLPHYFAGYSTVYAERDNERNEKERDENEDSYQKKLKVMAVAALGIGFSLYVYKNIYGNNATFSSNKVIPSLVPSPQGVLKPPVAAPEIVSDDVAPGLSQPQYRQAHPDDVRLALDAYIEDLRSNGYRLPGNAAHLTFEELERLVENQDYAALKQQERERQAASRRQERKRLEEERQAELERECQAALRRQWQAASRRQEQERQAELERQWQTASLRQWREGQAELQCQEQELQAHNRQLALQLQREEVMLAQQPQQPVQNDSEVEQASLRTAHDESQRRLDEYRTKSPTRYYNCALIKDIEKNVLQKVIQLECDNCAICSDEYGGDAETLYALLPCGHSFHAKCEKRMLARNINYKIGMYCPLCNAFYRQVWSIKTSLNALKKSVVSR